MNDEAQDEKERQNSDAEKPKRRDRWEKAQIIEQLSLPIAVVFFGAIVIFQQSQVADERKKVDRVTSLFEHLASDKSRPNSLARTVILHL